MINQLATFAATYNITPAQAVALPALFEKCASEMKMTPRAMYCAAMESKQVGEYMASVARKVGDEFQSRKQSA